MSENPIPRSTAPPSARIGVVESVIGIALFAVLIVLRVLAVRRQGWSSDEPQHLHVVWAWANGLLPYKDIFDNHTPLFHLLLSPIFRMVGERPDIVPVMRYAMIPLFGLSLWCVYSIGAALYSRRAGLWSALIAGATPPFFTMMGQFRTDVLWTTLWLLALALVTGGSLTRRRIFLTGLALGAAFSVSMKTTLFLLTLLVAFAAMRFWKERLHAFDKQMALPAGEWLRLAGCLLAGLAVIPGLLLAFFAAHGALGQMYYCIITHNIPDVRAPQHFAKRIFLSRSTLTLIPAFLAPWTALPLFARDPGRAGRRMFFLLVAGLYYHLLHSLWPMITPQDHVPLYPLLAVVATAFLVWFGSAVARRVGLNGVSWVLPCALAIVALATLGRSVIYHAHSEEGRITTIGDVLALTHPGEYVMDPKGETIFRPRPYYYVIETFTRQRLARGLLPDDLVPRLIYTRTAVVLEGDRMTEGSRQFIEQNYIPVAQIKVLGKVLPPDATGFDLAIPGNYTLVGGHTALTGTLDGMPLDGPRDLAAGHHEFHSDSKAGPPVLIWSRAIQAGYWPLLQ